MTMQYDNTRWAEANRVYEVRAAAGRKGAARTRDVRLAKRRQGITLHVSHIIQNEEVVPAIRLNGKWLSRLGFAIEDEVTLTAAKGRITIRRKE